MSYKRQIKVKDTMQKIYTNKGLSEDTHTSKGQKISAALYLVTNHVSDADPLKHALRTHALALVTDSSQLVSLARDIDALLRVAVLAGMIREQNARIIHAELTSYKALDTLETSTIEQLFGTSTGVSQMSFIPKTTLGSNAKIPNSNDQKSKRQDDILSFINQRKSAVIKDISTLFPDVSEKTIQRELGALVDAGKITKRGSKRWSIYLAVSA
jgi:hypothetical protein